MKGELFKNAMVFSYEGEENVVNINFDADLKDIWKVTGVATNSLFRGKGLGTKAMDIFFEKAKEEKKKIYPVCSFARYWVDNHPENSKYYATDEDLA